MFQGCAALLDSGSSEMKTTALDRAVYEPYEKRKTIEGYEEFIAKYPYNRFVAAARREIEDLRFAAVKKINTIEGYAEFIKKYPGNPHLPEVQDNIEKLELAYCRRENTSACYKSFISRHPQSMFLNEASKDLQEIEIDQFAQVLKENYGFDLPLYRLNLNRLKKELILESKEEIGDFSFFFSFITREGKNYFSTHLTFNNDQELTKIPAEVIPDEIFDDIIAGQLEYLNVKFKGKQKINGFSFEIASLPPNTSQVQRLMTCYFPIDGVDQFARGRIDKETLVKKTIVIPYSARRPLASQEVKPITGQQQEEALLKVQEVSEAVPLKWNCVEDGLAKDGKFVRTAPPAFSFEYPKPWVIDKLGDNDIFNGYNPPYTPRMNVIIMKIGKISGNVDDALKIIVENCATGVQKDLQEEYNKKDIKLLYLRPISAYEGYLAYEFEVRFTDLQHRSKPLFFAVNANVIFTDGYAIMILGSGPVWEEKSGRVTLNSVDGVKELFKTIAILSSKLPLPAREISATIAVKEESPSAPTVEDVTLALIQEETASPPGQNVGEPEAMPELMKWSSEKDGLVKDGKFIRATPPAFSLLFPEGWTVERAGDKFVFKGNDSYLLPAMQISVTKISGDEAAYLKLFPAVITESLRKAGSSNTSVLYSKPSDVYEGLPACEFEINYKPKDGKPLPRLTTYVNVIAKDGFAIILEGESSGDIDRLKTIYESINLKP